MFVRIRVPLTRVGIACDINYLIPISYACLALCAVHSMLIERILYSIEACPARSEFSIQMVGRLAAASTTLRLAPPTFCFATRICYCFATRIRLS